MKTLKNNCIILGITGCIAAYKGADLASKLTREGAAVKVVMTKSATQFITPLTFATLTKEPVITDLFETNSKEPLPHIALNKLANLLVVAPATANIIAKTAQGIADDALSTLILGATCRLIVAPAMHEQMWLNPATQANLALLKSRGCLIVEPEVGLLASGDFGMGRLAPVEKILAAIKKEIQKKDELAGKRVLITAGGTREPLDPVRFLGNPATGKMGYALAEETWSRGARTTLVSAPSTLPEPRKFPFFSVNTALEMRQRVLREFPKNDVVIMAAAVSDFRFKEKNSEKIRKDRAVTVTLEPNPDILAELGRNKTDQVLVGFAAETKNLLEQGRKKLQEKNLDLIVANDISRPESGFAADTNKALLITKDKEKELPLMSKLELAELIIDEVVSLLKKES